MLKEVEDIKDFVAKAMLCGSRVTCVPAPTGTDQDVIVLVDCDLMTVEWSIAALALQSAGWMLGGSAESDDDFESWTLGDVNLIITDNPQFYADFVLATGVCKRLNVMEKELRKCVFRAILYKESALCLDEKGQVEVPF